MKGMVSFCITILALHTKFFHATNAAPGIQPPFSSPGPLADSPARNLSPKPLAHFPAPNLSPEPSADSPAPNFSPEPSANSPAPNTSPGPSDNSPPLNLPRPSAAPTLSPEFSDNSPAPAPNHLPPPNGVFDVTKYGAVADGKTENSKAFMAAWNAACSNAGSSTFYIPKGTYFIGPVSFSGPCHNSQSPTMKIEGTLLAPTPMNAFPNACWIEFKNLNGFVLTGEAGVTNFDGQGAAEAWKQPRCKNSTECKLLLIISLTLRNVSLGIIDNISMVNSKSFHISIEESHHITVQNSKITAPWDSPNTDGIHTISSTNISIISSGIGVGDDCISIGPGCINITISDVRCGPGHGISIGSLGRYLYEQNVTGITVQNCKINSTQNGVRIKSWPGSYSNSASNIIFQDIVMFNVSNPLIIDEDYCPQNDCDLSKPSLVKLSNIFFKNISGTYNTQYAATLICSSSVPCEHIKIVDVHLNNTVNSTPTQSRLNIKGVINSFQVNNSTF